MQFSFFGALGSILASSGFASFAEDPRSLIMIIIACVLLYMGIGKKFEPLLLVPIAFGMLLANLPLTGLLNAPVDGSSPGMLWVFYQGVQHAIYPSIIFLGIGAMTDFWLADRASVLAAAGCSGAARHLLRISARACARLPGQGCGSHRHHRRCGRPYRHSASPSRLAAGLSGPPSLLRRIRYMALIPLIQPPIMRAADHQEGARGQDGAAASRSPRPRRSFSPSQCAIFVILLLPSIPRRSLACLMLGNLLRECGVVDRLSRHRTERADATSSPSSCRSVGRLQRPIASTVSDLGDH